MSAIALVPRVDGALDVERAAAFLAKCVRLDDVHEVRDKAKAIAAYQRSRAAGAEAERSAQEIVIRAERRMGELLAEAEKPRGGRGRKESAVTVTGVSHTQSSRWQRLASIPDRDFERHVKAKSEAGERLTVSGIVREILSPDRKEPDTFHSLVSVGKLRDALEARIASFTDGWPANGRALVPDLLRAMADEMENA